MIGDVCFSVAQYVLLRQEIYESHMRWGGMCIVLGFVLAYLPEIAQRVHGWIKQK